MATSPQLRQPIRELLDQLPDDERRRALTHPSYANERTDSYQRLEFLGDAVLGLAIAGEVYRQFPEAKEGELSKFKASAVSRDSCARVAEENGLAEMMAEVAPKEADSVALQRLMQQDRVLAALTESVIGAAFLELGYSAVEPAIVASFADRIGLAVDNPTDYKSRLQEFAQRRGTTVDYRVVSVDGPDHDRRFTMQVRIEDSGNQAVGEGRSKKSAEQVAAEKLISELHGDDAQGGDQ